MTARLYAMPASHPSTAAALMLRHKRIEYDVTWLVLPFTGPLLRLRRFPGSTVPALRIDRRRVQGSRAIAAALDELEPEPPLFPPSRRREVEDAERWGDEVLQPLARRVVVWQLRRERRLVGTQLADARRIQGARVALPPRLAALTSGPTVAWYARRIGASDAAVRDDLEALPAALDRIDAWIADGVLGGETPNAADFQIAPSLGQLMSAEELRGLIEPRPAGRLSRRILPEYPGRSRDVLPPDWLEAAGLPRPAD